MFPELFLYLPWLHFRLEICVLGIELPLGELSIWICLIVKCCLVFKATVVHDEEQSCGCGFLVQRLHQASGAQMDTGGVWSVKSSAVLRHSICPWALASEAGSGLGLSISVHSAYNLKNLTLKILFS